MPDFSRLAPAVPKGWDCELVFKPIRHIYFRIYPDKKKVRITAPSRISYRALSKAIEEKSAWLNQKLAALENSPRPFKPMATMQDHLSCMVWGQRLPVVRKAHSGRPKISLDGQDSEFKIIVQAPLDFNLEKEEQLWYRWLRMVLNQRILLLLEKWQPVMGAVPAQCRLRKMKTRWGSCNTVAKRIWINSLLVHLEPELLEYVLVHELAHLLEPGHTRRFYQILQTHLPDWKNKETRLDAIALRS